MQIGITAFLNDLSIGVVEFARAVEERGFAALYVPEHTHLPVRNAIPPGLVGGVVADDYRRSLDPFVTLAAAAAVTRRIRLGTGVCLVAQHDPIVLAKQIATLDQLSHGRFVFGVGYGWNRDEAEAHGVAWTERRNLVTEKMRCMQALWSQDEASFDGPHIKLAPSFSWPKPLQTPWVPCLLGGAPGPKLFEAIAAWGDGWIPIGGAGITAALPKLRAAMERAGRDPSGLQIVPFGTIPDAGKLDHFERLGVTEVVLRVPIATRDAMLATLDDHVRYLG